MIEGALWRKWVFFYIPLTLFVFVLLFPFYWMLITTFRPDGELYRPWNAINYTPSSQDAPGVITARVLVDPYGQALVLHVEDSGPGIPEAERDLVFQPFYRALGTNVDGSGLGLPIVLEIARQHGAEIQLEDAHPGQVPPGTRAVVRFMLAPVDNGILRTKSGSCSKRNSKRSRSPVRLVLNSNLLSKRSRLPRNASTTA